MKIKHLHVENFRSVKSFDADFGDRAIISGANKVGKTTIRNAIFYVLLNKLANGTAPENIRPHDKDGKIIDNIDIIVELTLDIEGREVVLKKIEKQKWTKHRGQSDSIFEGNITEYFINDIPKRQKDYLAFINEIVDNDTVLFGVNAEAFLNLDTKKRRAKLMSLASDVTIADIAKSDSKYQDIIPMLADGTVDELLIRSRKAIKGKNEQLSAIPIRIDELNRQLSDVDTAELELQRNQLKEDIAAVEDQIASVSNKTAVDELKERKMKLMFDINDIKRSESDALLQKRHELNQKASMLEMEATSYQNSMKEIKWKIELLETGVNANNAKIESMKPEYKEAKESSFNEAGWVFDENTTVCSLCGQKLPNDKIAALKKDFASKKQAAKESFEKNKADTLERIKTVGNNLAKDNIEFQKQIAEKQANIASKEKSLETVQQDIAKIKSELGLLPVEPDLTQNKDYNNLAAEIAMIDKEIADKEATASDVTELEYRKADLETQLQAVSDKLARVQVNNDIEDRITALNNEQRTIAQEIADEERISDLLNSLNRTYIEQTTESINKYFSIVKWRMFEKNLTNDGFMQTCTPLVNGSDYFSGLNYSDQLLCQLDICTAFQNVAGVKLFLTIDNSESIDNNRIPQTDRQLLIFKRTDEPKLTVR